MIIVFNGNRVNILQFIDNLVVDEMRSVLKPNIYVRVCVCEMMKMCCFVQYIDRNIYRHTTQRNALD